MQSRLLPLTFSFALCAAVVGPSCKKHKTTAHDAGIVDASIADAGAPDAAPGTCNDVANESPFVVIEQVPSPAPRAQGGTIVDGTYRLTAYHRYTGTDGASGPTGEQASWTLVISNGGTHVEYASRETTGESFTQTWEQSSSGNAYAQQVVCPATDTPLIYTGTFTAETGPRLLIYEEAGPATDEYELTRQ